MPIVCKVRVHESGEEFFAREGTYEKNRNGRLVPGYIIITPIGDRWIPCGECNAVSINGYPISKEVDHGKATGTTHGSRTPSSNYFRKGERKSSPAGAKGGNG